MTNGTYRRGVVGTQTLGDTSQFFDSVRDHSEVKHRILGKFIPPWRAKLGFKVVKRGDSRIWYVDAFAGEGRYADGKDGSPIIAAKQAVKTVEEARGYQLSCVNVEQSASRFRQLVENTASWREAGVEIHNLKGDSSALIPDIRALIGETDPALVFVDPFGIKPLNFNAIAPLLRRPGEIDLLLTFITPGIARLVRDYPDYVTRAIGSSNWRQRWDSEGVDAVLAELCANLTRVGNFLGIASYAIRSAKDEAPHYHLLLGSRHEDAYELVNDFICEEESKLDEKRYRQLAQATYLPLWDDDESAKALLTEIVEFGTTQRATTRAAIRRHILLNDWGMWHTKDIRKAVSALVKEGLCQRLLQGKIDTDPLVFGTTA